MSYMRFWVAIAGWCCVFGLLSVPISAAEYERIDDPDGIFAVWPDSTIDWTRHIRPIGKKEFARFRGPAAVNDPNGNLMVRAWKFVPEVPGHAGGGIVESRNRLKSEETALIIVHPWGLEDGQGWKGPQAYNCYGYAFMGLYEDNILCLAHLKDVVRPFVNTMRGRLGVVGYSLPGTPDAIRGKLYQGYDGKRPSEAERKKGRAELKASLTGLKRQGLAGAHSAIEESRLRRRRYRDLRRPGISGATRLSLRQRNQTRALGRLLHGHVRDLHDRRVQKPDEGLQRLSGGEYLRWRRGR